MCYNLDAILQIHRKKSKTLSTHKTQTKFSNFQTNVHAISWTKMLTTKRTLPNKANTAALEEHNGSACKQECGERWMAHRNSSN